MDRYDDIVIAPIFGNDETKVVGWAPTRMDATTMMQREYMRAMARRLHAIKVAEVWRKRKAA